MAASVAAWCRSKASAEFIDYAKGFDGVWWASREDIAEWYLANHESHIGAIPLE